MQRNEKRLTRQARGYDRAWQRLRRWHLNREPLCVACRKAGRLRPATDVDHIQSFRRADGSFDHDKRLSADNLQSLCRKCHGLKTAETEGVYAEAIARKGAHSDGTPRDPLHPWASQC